MSIIRRKFTKEQKLDIADQSMTKNISIESLAEQIPAVGVLSIFDDAESLFFYALNISNFAPHST